MTDVVLFHDADCPNVDAARSAIREAFGRLDEPPEWREVERNDAGVPRDWLGYGSPTVLVDGNDVMGEAASTDDGCSCRLYTDNQGQTTGAPPVDQIVAALEKSGDGGCCGGSCGCT